MIVRERCEVKVLVLCDLIRDRREMGKERTQEQISQEKESSVCVCVCVW